MLTSFVADQMRPWQDASFDIVDLNDRLKRLNTSPSIGLFQATDDTVSLLDKPADVFVYPSYVSRFHCYLRLLIETFRAFPTRRDMLIAVDIQDEAPDHEGLPVFSFQKLAGQRNLLLPDVDLIALDYLGAAPQDHRAYADKTPVATFCGSTTGGGHITADAVCGARFPRLRAARFFADRPEVDFRLTSVVQCDPDADALMRAEGFGTGPLDWDFTYRGKFALSLDGNGAACSRPAIILKSNCVLMKYRSNCLLHYSSGLIDGRNMLDITSEEQVIAIVREERRSPGLYAPIAAAGSHFAENVLCKGAALNYTGALLKAYADRVR
ncbi:hypothetical protein MKK69_14345 [Methylobacterium sp. J-026]|uniref:hypothetical protein n=1 Tax=Methylobacterium sp. J-026 TaxID=2836624 RepID=UPI001FB91DCC|nr:hypothetical protein [Methylobacterium sp. J-026]MCJ2135218.1 hypothetical protein [Methylobacterium sp. J-026]